MKQCENLLLYTSGELPPQARKAFVAHLKNCAACREELAFLVRTEEALKAPSAPPRPVEALLAKTTRKKSFFAGWKAWKPALAGTALVAVGVLAWWVGLPPDKGALQTQEVLAYMSEHLDEEYLTFSDDLKLFEQEF